MERAMWLGGQIVPMNFAMMARIGGDFSVEQLHAALARVRERHPLVAVRVAVDEVEGACFVSEGVPDFSVRVLTGCGDADWTAVVKEELGEPFVWDRGPFVRFVVLRGPDFSDLVAVCHHGICDGMAGAYLLRDVLQTLGEPAVSLAPLPVPPDLWALMPAAARVAPRARFQMAATKALLRVARLAQRIWRRVAPPRPAVSTVEGLPTWKRFCVLGWALDEAQTSQLMARCRAEGTSVHAAICAAWLRAFAEMQPGRKSWMRKVSSPISLRNRLTPSADEAFGLFMSVVVTAANCAPERDLWDIARDIKQELNKGSTDEKIFRWLLNMQSMVSAFSDADMLSVLDEFASQPVAYDFSITNLGRLDFPVRYGPLRLEAMYGPAVNTSEQERTVGVTTVGGRMTFTLAFRDFVLDPAAAEQLKARAMARLGEAAGWQDLAK
jgi:NRPS condensation-like uncharacterized protein